MNWGLRDFYGGVEDENVRYTVIHIEGRQLPHAVVRMTGTVEEAFTHDLHWQPATLLSQVPNEPTWIAREANLGYANGFLVEMVRVIRGARYDSEVVEFKYHAVFKDTVDVLDLDKAYLLIRQPDPHKEHKYVGYGMWEETDKLYRLWSGRDWTEESVSISAAEAEHLKRQIDRRWAVNHRHHLRTEHGRAAAVIRVLTVPDREPREWVFTGDGRWKSADLLGQAPEPGRLDVEVGWEHAVEQLAVLVQQHRAGSAGGYAVFHRATDVLDLELAYDVVPELGPGHRISLPLREGEAEPLATRVAMRNSKRHAEVTDGRHHFALFNFAADSKDLDRAYSVVRCPAGRTGPWEVFRQPGDWPPTRQPASTHTLPIGGADIERITRRLAAAEIRYFEIRSREVGPVAKIRLTRTTEEAAEDLGWIPSDFLVRQRDEPDWTVAETDEWGMARIRFHAARLDRSVALRDNEYQYLAIFAEVAAAFDLGNATMVVRKKNDVVEEFVRPGGWARTDRTRQFDHVLTRPYWQLPITEEELRGLIAD
ncbi:hypothetical protein [Crossiella cryophila]|uniref:Uncharacterized protein n=1 Tax=Crossiella cryophila TaxID=43355 RepID=A0A7W7CC96_9PSEU|nr:hypothetical protein [Crossiella cryophila]MBB4678506.1 hypothetical protein [Crossiella cryophila]